MQLYQYAVSVEKRRQFSCGNTLCIVEAIQSPCCAKDVPSPLGLEAGCCLWSPDPLGLLERKLTRRIVLECTGRSCLTFSSMISTVESVKKQRCKVVMK